MNEKWKEIEGLNGYQVSNKGNVRLLKNLVTTNDPCGYPRIAIKGQTHKVHQLVWDAFGDKPRGDLSINHINHIKTDNNIGNLEVIPQRENCAKRTEYYKKNGLPLGVYYHKRVGKYIAQIRDGEKRKYLGAFSNPEEAGDAYKKALAIISSKKIKRK